MMMRQKLTIWLLDQLHQLAMKLRVKEYPWLSRSLLARSDPTRRCKPILPLLIGPFQVLHLLADRNGNVHPTPIPKRKQSKSSTYQVMTQIKFPPYRRPRRPLDLVVIEIIFGCLFEVFPRASQAAGTGTSVGDDTQPPKRTRAPTVKTILVPK
jgi:hypothetical protein